MRHYLTLLFTLCLSSLCHAQHRHVIVDIETGLPQRYVRVGWDGNHETYTIWDGSFKVDSVRDSLEISKPGYMTLILNPEELTDTICILPTHNVLDEVVVYGVYAGKFAWTLKPITKEEIAAMNYNRRGINVDVIGGIIKLFTYKKRKRLKRAKKILAEY